MYCGRENSFVRPYKHYLTIKNEMKIEKLLEIATHQKSLKQSLLTFIRVVSDGYNAHGSRNVFAKPHHVCSSVLVCSNNCMLDPISPEQQVSVHCHVKRMLRSDFGQYLQINNFLKNQEDFFRKIVYLFRWNNCYIMCLAKLGLFSHRECSL